MMEDLKFTGKFPEYLGDAVYASFDGYHVWVETSNGLGLTNSVALDPDVFARLIAYQENIVKTAKTMQDHHFEVKE